MPMKRLRWLLCFTLILPAGITFGTMFPQNAPTPEEHFKDVRSLILRLLDKSPAPSVSVAAARDSEIIWEESFGWAEVEQKIEATPHTAYSLASISKPITATGLMILVEKGLIDLDRPADDYLGDAKLTAYHGQAADATVQRLLHHTAGLPTHWHFFYQDDPYLRPTMDETIRRYAILTAPPGLVYNYSNLGYGILDYIIERKSGLSYPEFMAREVFHPLGMHDSAVYTEPGPENRVAQRYTGKKRLPFYDFDHRGASAVYCSAHDLIRFGMFHLKNHLRDQKPILKDSTIEQMQTAVDPKVPDSNYKLGWATYEEFGYRFVAHGGGMPGVSTLLRLIPAENLAVVVLTNGTGLNIDLIAKNMVGAMLPDYAEKVLSHKSPPRRTTNPKETPREFLGTWEGEITTHAGKFPIQLVFAPQAKVRCRLVGKKYADMKPRIPLGRYSFEKDMFFAGFGIALPPEDMARDHHHIRLSLKRLGDTLVGDAAARSYQGKFNLPSYIKLKKKSEK